MRGGSTRRRRLLDQAERSPAVLRSVDSFDPHEPWSPPRKYLDMYGDPGYEGPEIGVTQYGFAATSRTRSSGACTRSTPPR